jgi:hypothetical protein
VPRNGKTRSAGGRRLNNRSATVDFNPTDPVLVAAGSRLGHRFRDR